MVMSTLKHLLSLWATALLFPYYGYSQNKVAPKLEYDHILLFVDNHNLKDSLNKMFTPAAKLTTRHTQQGTTGYYYLFYNTYIELLYLTDSTKAHLNQKNFGSDYVQRWNADKSYCPIGFGMVMMPWDTVLADTGFYRYISDDSPDGDYYLMSHYNGDAGQPLIYISQPHRTYQSIQTLEDVNQRPEEIREDLKHYLTHSSGAKTLSQIVFTSPQGNGAKGNLTMLEADQIINVESSDTPMLTLIFDGGKNNKKEFALNDRTKLIIKY
jgi:hypothetical protein